MKQSIFNESNEHIKIIAKEYKLFYGIYTNEGENIYSIDTDYCMYVADKFEQVEHNPKCPYVSAAYEALIFETIQQYKWLVKAGYNCTLFGGKGEPYTSSAAMQTGLKNCKWIFILSTANDFGNEPITIEQRENNPMLQDSGYKDMNGQTLLVNDVFRFVHDVFGHCERGNGFGAIGEFNAWDCHARMFTKMAGYAMTVETLAQNCWVNFGKHMRDAHGKLLNKNDANYLPANKRPFAPQKVGLLSNFKYPATNKPVWRNWFDGMK
jgi:hypothetical protein